jgi:hypothetical protein
MVSLVNYRPLYLVSNDGSISITYQQSNGYTNIQTTGGGGVPASPVNSVQFNNAGAFGGSANFTYTSGTNTITFGNITGSALSMTIQPKTPTASEAAGALAFTTKNAVITNGTGGAMSFTSGNGVGTGLGGNLDFISGSGLDGGGLSILAGNGSRNGGAFTARAGDGYTGVAGGFTLTAGNNERSGGAAGTISLGGGIAVGGDGGDIYLTPGYGAVNGGSLLVTTDAGTVFEATLFAGSYTQQLGFYGVIPVDQPSPTASGTQNVLDSVVSSLINLGLIQSGGLTNASTLTAAGANTQIQFNNAGAFGATAGFSYDTSTYTFNIAPANISAIVIEPVAPTGSQTSTSISLRTKNASATNGTGGLISFSTGSGLGTGASGAMYFNTGSSTSTVGAMTFVAGNGTNEGGSMIFSAGIGGGTNSAGGNFTAAAGSGKGTIGGGSFELTAGSLVGTGTGFGGSFTLLSGYGGVNGTGGDFQLLTGGGATSGSIYIGTDSNSSCLTITEVATVAQMGFFNAAPIAKPTVTGSRATGAALVSLLNQLAALGLITNSTTA